MHTWPGRLRRTVCHEQVDGKSKQRVTELNTHSLMFLSFYYDTYQSYPNTCTLDSSPQSRWSTDECLTPSRLVVFRWSAVSRRSRASTWIWATGFWLCAPPTGTSSLQNQQVRGFSTAVSGHLAMLARLRLEKILSLHSWQLS